ncbi:rRNA biogenesis protein rrp5 [Anaerotalea alkaliphila]|uniref:rRNA biogenesis protein rrp5 n=1 Tax=Anaerotalea alkaliphila TaxID=2662126 RepID=A0A7X5KN59_9FIRM|nr:rRNA biogenesis protein rrp5 [Anaerotalea alkaliphila]NDL68524.1 rRNA biogenesis protein rrp5 [Anaerotalea alkaliphila]
MSKVKLLLDVVSDMRSLADSIEVVCKAMTESDAVPEKVPATKTETTKEPEIPLEKVRMVLAEKSQLGFTAEVRAIIGKYGADKLSAVDKAYYADILKDAEVLGNG